MAVRNTFAVNFLCESSRKDKEGLSPIYCSLSVNGKRVRFPVQRKANPDTFYKLLGSKRGNDIKEFCRAIEEKVYKIQAELINESIPVTTSNLLTYFRTGGVKTYTLEMLWSEYITTLQPRRGVSMTEDTFHRYEAARDIMFRKFGKDCEVSSLTPGMLQELYDELRSGNFVSTASQKMQKVKTVITYAFTNGHIGSNPAVSVRLSKQNKEVEWLTVEELERMYNTNLPSKSLERVRDLFILQASCGLAYTDLTKLTTEDIQEQDGTYFICKKRVKTGVKYTAVILPLGVEVLKKYDWTIPKIPSNQKYNSYIKAVASLSGIEKNIHSHCGRHSYCTSLLNKGVRLETVSKAAGHSNTKITQHYARLLDRTVLEEVSSKF